MIIVQLKIQHIRFILKKKKFDQVVIFVTIDLWLTALNLRPTFKLKLPIIAYVALQLLRNDTTLQDTMPMAYLMQPLNICAFLRLKCRQRCSKLIICNIEQSTQKRRQN